MQLNPERNLYHTPLEEVDKQSLIRSWLNKRGITELSKISGNEFANPYWLQTVGIISRSDLLLSTQVVTGDFLGSNKDFGDGWFKGGAESFYKICEIVYETNSQVKRKLIAYKALHSMGDLTGKMTTEAVWMAHMVSQGICAEVYAVGSGTIVKHFLEEDPVEQKLTDEEYSRQLSAIIETLRDAGLTPLRSTSNKVEVVQHQGRLMLIDLGSGDMSGPDALTFIRNVR